MKKKLEDHKDESWKIFERIAGRYDIANRVLSLGMDKSWRRAMLDHIPSNKSLVHVDIATGTGDVILFFRDRCPRIKKAIGVDRSPKVLIIAEKKTATKPFASSTQYMLGNGEALPLKTSSANITTLSFGIRNFNSPLAGLKEIRRVLKPGGKAMILEFSTPNSRFIRFFYFFYLRTIVPIIGGILSGSYSSYRYLNRTIETFPSGQNFLNIMKEAGLKNSFVIPMLLGGVSLYIAEK